MRFLSCLAVAALAPVARAGTLTVGPAGSGAQFTEIQAAIDAAQDGDVILVRSGTYQRIAVDKALRILGAGSGAVFVSEGPMTGVAIRDIAAGEEFVLSGIRLVATPATRGVSILIESCAGTVVLDDVRVDDDQSRTGLEARDCERVFLLDSQILGAGVPGFGGVSVRAAVRSIRSGLWIANTRISGRGDPNIVAPAAHGLELRDNSRLYLWRSQIEGGESLSLKPTFGGPADGGTGILAVRSRIELFGGPGTAIRGGDGPFVPLLLESFPGGPGLELRNGSSALIQQGASIAGGFDGTDRVQSPSIRADASSTARLTSEVFPSLTSSAQQVQIGNAFHLTLEGNPGAVQVLYLALRTGPTTSYFRVDGYAVLDQSLYFEVARELLPPSGARTLTFTVPNDMAFIGSTLYFQAVEALAVQFAIGNPDLVTITG